MRAKTLWVLTASVTAGLSLLVGLLVSNFVGGETKIERRIERLYALDDPRCAGVDHLRDLYLLIG
jgi:cardiolipin synthase